MWRRCTGRSRDTYKHIYIYIHTHTYWSIRARGPLYPSLKTCQGAFCHATQRTQKSHFNIGHCAALENQTFLALDHVLGEIRPKLVFDTIIDGQEFRAECIHEPQLFKMVRVVPKRGFTSSAVLKGGPEDQGTKFLGRGRSPLALRGMEFT